jgi:NADH-quinone oxidoreductase subunit E
MSQQRGVWLDTERMGRSDQPVEPLSEDFHTHARGIIARYPAGQERSSLLPLLYLAQSEHGFVSAQAMGEIAALLSLTRAEVQAVATFYTMFKREPQGAWLVSVCTQPSCGMAGGDTLLARLRSEIDGTDVTIEEVECLCACDGAPVFSVNYENYERMPVDDAVALVKGLAEGGSPPPGARGRVPSTFLEVNREMAGVDGDAGE